MRRRAVIVAVWLAGTVASVALAWFAVSAVGDEATSTPDIGGASAAPALAGSSTTSTTIGPSPANATTAPGPASSVPSTSAPQTSAAPAPTTSVPTPAPAPAPAATPRSEVFDSRGGTMGATCRGAAASLDFATPRSGYAAEVHDPGPEKVDVRFDAGSGVESRIVVRCVDGAPTAEVREDD